MLVHEHPDNEARMNEWRERWQPRVDAAMAPFGTLLEDLGDIAPLPGGAR
jgi:hypothetical protein